MPAPISACLIVRNEAVNLGRCLESIRPHVEEIVVVDTGSNDATPEIARSILSATTDRFEIFYGCNEGGQRDAPIEDFSRARNFSFSLATKPWTLWIDGDDQLKNAENLARVCARYESEPTVLLMFPYEYSHDHHGNVTCRHYRERLFRTGRAGSWQGPVHEVYVPEGSSVVVQSDEVTWIHRREGKSDTVPLRNLRILERWLEQHDGPEVDARMLYYTALEYAQTGDLARSIKFHERYCEKSGWDDEKCLSLLDIARHHQTLGNYERSIEWATRAMLLKEEWAEPRFSLARAYYFLAQKGGPEEFRNWERSVNHARQGLALPPTQTPLFVNPLERAVDVHRYLNVGLSRTGRIHEAQLSVNEAIRFAPDDPNLAHNRVFYEGIVARCDFDAAISKMRASGQMSTEQEMLIVERIMKGKFRAVASEEDRKSISDPPRAPVTANPGKLDVVLFTGVAYERWNPETLERGGMGGSETMAWEMSRRLVRLGHRVRVYADAEGLEGTFEGVEWIDYKRFTAPESGECPTSDVVISSRIAELVDYPLRCRARLAWVHDVHMGDALTNKRGLKFDRYLCLSEWHKAFFLQKYPFLHESSVIVTRNGIDLSRYERTDVARDPHRMIYSSSPDRGLQVAIKCMPRIRARVPDASLHVFYGFDNWLKSHDPGQRNLAQVILAQLDAYEDFGVVHHGRVPGKELALAQLSSGVLAYPTWFSETNFITGMESQAAGLRIVTSPIAAINETVGDRAFRMIPGDWQSKEYQSAYVDACVDAMTLEREDDRKSISDYARSHFSLDSLAIDWEEMLNRTIVEVERDVLPKYQPVSI